MKLNELIAAVDGLSDQRLPEVEITGIEYRDKSVTPGTLFFCVPGQTVDGHDFAAGAVARGAVALVCSRPLGLGVPELLVGDVRASMAPVAAAFFGEPSKRLRTIGITGTNGKTTTAFLVRHIFETSGLRSGLLGTVESVVGGERRTVERTTPEAIDLQRSFAEMLAAGDRACVMEVSSHALALDRVDAVAFDAAVFTNLTQDHLDFHGTHDSYFEAKRKLFLGQGERPRAVINLDDEWGRKLAGELPGATGFAIDRDAQFRARSVEFDPGGAGFRLLAGGGEHDVRLPLPGVFNVYNALAAIAASAQLGIEIGDAVAALADAPRVPGRFEPIDEGQQFSVFVDYAHTPDSLENVLSAARQLLGSGDGSLICVFGAGGDRDRDKRPAMGRAASSLSDRVIVTSDNPRSEEPAAIIEQIVAGAGSQAAQQIEPDRRRAIELALTGASRGDIVVIAGKGHEQGQEFEGGRKIPFDDREVARAILKDAQ